MLCPEERRKEVQRSFRPQDDDTVPELKIRIAYGYETFWDLLEDMVRNTLPRYSLFANLRKRFLKQDGSGPRSRSYKSLWLLRNYFTARPVNKASSGSTGEHILMQQPDTANSHRPGAPCRVSSLSNASLGGQGLCGRECFVRKP
jgi:hypothetical protein